MNIPAKNGVTMVLLAGLLLLGCGVFFSYSYLSSSITIELETSRTGMGQLFYDIGSGFTEQNSQWFALEPNKKYYTIRLPAKHIQSLRLDPMDSSGYFIVKSIHYRSALSERLLRGNELKRVLHPNAEVQWLASDDNQISAVSLGNDPYLEIKSFPVDNHLSVKRRFLVSAVFVLLACMSIYVIKLFCKIQLDRIWQRCTNWITNLLQNKQSVDIMCFRRALLILTVTTCILIGGTVGINYIVDPFRIFHSGFLKHEFQLNERFNKIEFLANHHNQFNSYLFGSSRMASTQPQTFERYLSGSRFYNMAVSGGTMYDHLEHLKHFINNGYEVKNVVLQLDSEALHLYRFDASNYLNRHHPSISGQNRLAFYFSYLPILPYEYIKGKIEVNLVNQSMKIFDIEHSGSIIETKWETMIAENQDIYIRNQPTFYPVSHTRIHGREQLENNLKDLASFVTLCRENQINVIVYVSPMNHVTMDEVDFDDYQYMLQRISAITPFWDFSGYNSVTNNNYNYYEKSHYRPYVAEWIAGRIFNDQTKVIDADFGRYVDTRTIGEDLQRLHREFTFEDAKHWRQSGE